MAINTQKLSNAVAFWLELQRGIQGVVRACVALHKPAQSSPIAHRSSRVGPPRLPPSAPVPTGAQPQHSPEQPEGLSPQPVPLRSTHTDLRVQTQHRLISTPMWTCSCDQTHTDAKMQMCTQTYSAYQYELPVIHRYVDVTTRSHTLFPQAWPLTDTAHRLSPAGALISVSLCPPSPHVHLGACSRTSAP